MSIDETEPKVKLTKEEKAAKKARKEAKKLQKLSAASTPAATSGTTTPAVIETVASTETEPATPGEAVDGAKKDKKKKRKDRDEVIEGESVIRGGESGAEKQKKDKKDKKKRKVENGEVAQPDPSTVAAPTQAESKTLAAPAESTSGLSKKQQKKLARAAEAQAEAAAVSTAEASSSSAAAAPGPFLSEHTEYLNTNAITLIPHLFPPHLDIASLPISTSLRPYLKKFTKPTPIQACSWPPLLAYRDVVGIAETGSGKTLAFGVPGLNRLTSSGKKKKGPHMLVIAPTRELAQQSHSTLLELGKEAGISSVCIFGGVGKDDQIRGIKESKVVVGTPGRLLDLADSGDLDLSAVKYLCLDEADRMLDAGFENDIRRIIAHCPDKTSGRQTVMFSATWPESVRRLAATFLNDPVRITVGSDELSANKRIEQIVEVLDQSFQKDARLQYHLRAHMKAHPSSAAAPTRILVFALYKKEAQRLEMTIKRNGFSVMGLHGDMSQDARFKALDAFKEGKVNILVATDVAARGLDIPDVGLVVNVTFPLTTEDFVHRCGRTGRAGKSGKAVTFFTGENHEKSLAGEFMRVLRDVGAEIPKEMDRFPSTIKKKEHGSYGAFYKDTTNAPKATKITFD